jgi:hypothetical protein
VVRQDRARRHRTRRLHLRPRPAPKAHAVHPPVQQSPQNHKVALPQPDTSHHSRFSRYSPLAPFFGFFGSAGVLFGSGLPVAPLSAWSVATCRASDCVSAILRFSITGSGSKFYCSRPTVASVSRKKGVRASYHGIAAHYVHPLSLIESRSQWSACTGNIAAWRGVPQKNERLKQLKFLGSRNVISVAQILHYRLGQRRSSNGGQATARPPIFCRTGLTRESPTVGSLPTPAQRWGDLVPMATTRTCAIPGRNGSSQ